MARVSVVMPVFNGRTHLREAVDSILGQTHEDLELLVVDDASSDGSMDVLEDIADPRLTIIIRRTNGGAAAAANEGLACASGEFIARMDCDDISAPTRIAAQVAVLEADPSLVVCQTFFELFDGIPSRVITGPRTSQAVRDSVICGHYLAGPSMMIRASALQEHHLWYAVQPTHADDYRLLAELAKIGGLGVVPEPLYRYRIHDGQKSMTNPRALLPKPAVVAQAMVIRQELIAWVAPQSCAGHDEQLSQLVGASTAQTSADLNALFAWSNAVIAENEQHPRGFGRSGFEELVRRSVVRSIVHRSHPTPSVLVDLFVHRHELGGLSPLAVLRAAVRGLLKPLQRPTAR